jgi:hypothetical protein
MKIQHILSITLQASHGFWTGRFSQSLSVVAGLVSVNNPANACLLVNNKSVANSA